MMCSSIGATIESCALGRIWQSALMEKSNGMTPTMAIAMRMMPPMSSVILRLVLEGFRSRARAA